MRRIQIRVTNSEPKYVPQSALVLNTFVASTLLDLLLQDVRFPSTIVADLVQINEEYEGHTWTILAHLMGQTLRHESAGVVRSDGEGGS